MSTEVSFSPTTVEVVDVNTEAREKLFNDLAECARELSTLDYEQVRDFTSSEEFEPEKERILDDFHKNFKDVPMDCPLRMETIRVLALIGIVVYKEPEEEEEESNNRYHYTSIYDTIDLELESED
jgi:hypothetical protein